MTKEIRITKSDGSSILKRTNGAPLFSGFVIQSSWVLVYRFIPRPGTLGWFHGARSHPGRWLQLAAQLAGAGGGQAAPFGPCARRVDPAADALSGRHGHADHDLFRRRRRAQRYARGLVHTATRGALFPQRPDGRRPD